MEIEQCTGTQFDPDAVKAFIQILPTLKIRRDEETVIDPVCLMKINPLTAPASLMYKHQMYYFCNAACKYTFWESPGKYINT